MRRYPFSEAAAIAIADFDGAFGELSPRNQLIRMIDKAAALGFDVMSAFEFEFFLLDETPDTLREKQFRNLEHFAKANRTYSLQSAVLYEDSAAAIAADAATDPTAAVNPIRFDKDDFEALVVAAIRGDLAGPEAAGRAA